MDGDRGRSCRGNLNETKTDAFVWCKFNKKGGKETQRMRGCSLFLC